MKEAVAAADDTSPVGAARLTVEYSVGGKALGEAPASPRVTQNTKVLR